MNTSIGVSKPFIAIYNPNNGTPSYSGGKRLGMATAFSLDVQGSDPAILYADNGPAEAVDLFSGGSGTVGVHRLSLANLAMIRGQDVSAAGGVTFKADANAPYMGIGVVSMVISGGQIRYLAIVNHKIKFRQPNVTLVTRSEPVEYQVPELAFQVMRDDSADAKWMFMEEYLTEAAAVNAIGDILNIPEAERTAALATSWTPEVITPELSSLQITANNGGIVTMEPAFYPGITTYTATFNGSANESGLGFTVFGTASNGTASLKVKNVSKEFGALNTVDLSTISTGQYVDTAVTITVTDGETTKTYSITVRAVRVG